MAALCVVVDDGQNHGGHNGHHSHGGRQFDEVGAMQEKGAEPEHGGTLSKHVEYQSKQSMAVARQMTGGLFALFAAAQRLAKQVLRAQIN
jgi:ABC-type Zn2+ transport system substrate-binding protein/surface adhesin